MRFFFNKYLIFFILFFAVCSFTYSQIQNEKYNIQNKYIYKDSIFLFKGDKINIQADSNNYSLMNFHFVSEILDSSKTITLSFTIESFNNKNGMILKIYNPFNKKLIYNAKIRTLKNYKYVETSVIPIMPRLFSFETWPYEIESIILYGFKLMD
jgi:hypothetical protein